MYDICLPLKDVLPTRFILNLDVAASLGCFTIYCAMTGLLLYILHTRPLVRSDVLLRRVFWGFIFFFAAGALEYFVDMLIVWWPLWSVRTYIRFFDALVGSVLLVMLLRWFPSALRFHEDALRQNTKTIITSIDALEHTMQSTMPEIDEIRAHLQTIKQTAESLLPPGLLHDRTPL